MEDHMGSMKTIKTWQGATTLLLAGPVLAVCNAAPTVPERFDAAEAAEAAEASTGTQFFSGTIAGSEPVVLHDDRFRFVVDLSTGETRGEVHLGRSNDAPHKGGWYECDLIVVGSGMTTPEGDGMVDYSGECTRRGNAP
jgi:hypothetical protein